MKAGYKYILLFTIFISVSSFPQIYSDQHYVLRIDSIFNNIEENVGLKLSADGKSIMLVDSLNDGYVILKPQYSQQPFDRGLPSWNGTAPDFNGGFKIQMRFPFSTGWSPWLTVGFWKSNVWSSYGATTYGGGYIDYDEAKLYTYRSGWQFKLIMTRTNTNIESPTLHKLSFFVSDSRKTSSLNYTQILNDNPPVIFIPTGFVYQYGVDPTIGGEICSPTSVSMILKSYQITVDPYQFAIDNYDPYFNMFGIWPRAVQNASEYGLDGAVTRYRTWSETYEVLANGGRIAMSIGQPLYSGHLVMLAGFTSDGKPIVHDPARSDGYSYVYSKSDISHSWFDKGGVGYTFYDADSIYLDVENDFAKIADDFKLDQNYPNPFNPITNISFTITNNQFVSLKVYDILGNDISTLVNEELDLGNYKVQFNASNLSSGVYLYKLQAGDFSKTQKMILIK